MSSSGSSRANARWFFRPAAVLAVLAAGCGEHDRGVRDGRAAARQARGEGGELAARAAAVGMALVPGKIDPKKSAEWNAGFRDGYAQEVRGE